MSTIYNQNERAVAKISQCNRTGLLSREAKLEESCEGVVVDAVPSAAAGGGGEIGGTSHVPNAAFSCLWHKKCYL